MLIKNDPDPVDLGKIATVFIVFGLLSLLTSWIYSAKTEEVVNTSFRPNNHDKAAKIGPINVSKYDKIYNINIKIDYISVNSWSFVEGQVLNSDKQYLFSFGKELWHEKGRDADGAWRDIEDKYSINITFPKRGTYYLQFNTESNRGPTSITVTVSTKRGSSLPHLWFGIVILIIGIALDEIKNRTIRSILDRFES